MLFEQSRPAAAKPATDSRRVILLIEDNEADTNLTKFVHDEVKKCSWLEIVPSGQEAMRYLLGEGRYANRKVPDLILLDVVLPIKSGLDLIGEIRALPGFELMPLVMISGSDDPNTLEKAYQLGANCVIKKPREWKSISVNLSPVTSFGAA